MEKLRTPLYQFANNVGRLVANRPRTCGLALVTVIGMSLIPCAFIKSHSTEDASLPSPVLAQNNQNLVSIPLPLSPVINAAQKPVQDIHWQVASAKHGDNLATIFKKAHLSQHTLMNILSSDKSAKVLKHVQPGDQFHYYLSDNKLQTLVYGIDDDQTLVITRQNDDFQAKIEDVSVDHALNELNLAYHQAQEATTTVNNTSVALPLPQSTRPTEAEASTPAQVIANNWQNIQIQSGDTIEKIFKHLGLSANDMVAVATASKHLEHFKNLQPGQTVEILADGNHQLQQLIYIISKDKSLSVVRQDDHFVAKLGTKPEIQIAAGPIKLETETATAASTAQTETIHEPVLPANVHFTSITVNRSLAKAAQSMGLTKKEVAQLSDIISQNLSHDVRKGDKLSLLLQENNIIALNLVSHGGRAYQVIQFKDSTGHEAYYNPEGKTLIAPISRAPLKYTYISSYFTINRWHPILHFFRSHQGVDYAAPEGTPIKAAGNGKIAFLGNKGGYGHAIIIQHNRSYSTLYGHLSRFAHLSPGDTVTKGEVIGYVGHTGLASGSHLHFEIHVNNVPRDPLSVTLPSGSSVPKAFRQQFFNYAKLLLARLNVTPQVHLAQKAETAKKNKVKTPA